MKRTGYLTLPNQMHTGTENGCSEGREITR